LMRAASDGTGCVACRQLSQIMYILTEAAGRRGPADRWNGRNRRALSPRIINPASTMPSFSSTNQGGNPVLGRTIGPSGYALELATTGSPIRRGDVL
jgi:hypothetical protein